MRWCIAAAIVITLWVMSVIYVAESRKREWKEEGGMEVIEMQRKWIHDHKQEKGKFNI